MLLRRRSSRVSEHRNKQSKVKENLDPSTLQNLASYPSIWHAAIDQQRWALLEKHLESYRWEIESQKSRRSGTQLQSFSVNKNRSPKGNHSISTERASFPQPLTAKDNVGRTPLHLAVQKDTRTPLNILNKMISLENVALSQADDSGRYVIHHAILGERDEEELKLLVAGCPKVLVALDRKGKSAVSLSIERTIGIDAADKKAGKHAHQVWGLSSEEHLTWQSSQKEKWRRVGFLLDLCRSEDISISPKEHNKLVVLALQEGAPIVIVEKMIGASRQKQTNSFAENWTACARAVNAIFKYNYPISLLKLILMHAAYDDKDPPTEILRALRQGLMKHYKGGFVWQVERLDKQQSSEVESNSICLRDEVIRFHSTQRLPLADCQELQRKDKSLDPACKAWFDMLKFLLVYTSTRDPTGLKSHHLLHVALSIPACPPSIIELIVSVYPLSRNKEHPVSGELPIHTACRVWKTEKIQEDGFSIVQVLKMMILGKNNGHFVWRRFHNRLPIHHAVAAGKDWQFIQAIMKFDKRTLLSRDPQTKLFPFQQAAALSPWGYNEEGDKRKDKWLLVEARALFKPSEWQAMDESEQHTVIVGVAKECDQGHIAMIFHLLKANPDAIVQSITSDAPTKGSVDGNGPISLEYIGWLYVRDTASGTWSLNSRRLDMVNYSIKNGSIHRGMVSWWNRILTLIWLSYSGDFGSLNQRHGKHLLHCAVSNADTPPMLIDLLVKVSPQSAMLPFPGTNTYPIHAAAATAPYIPKSFEKKSDGSSFEIVFGATPSNLLKDYGRGRSVLEIAIESGKSYHEIQYLVQLDPQACLRPDHSETRLLPFQLMALPRLTDHQYCIIVSDAKRMARVNWALLSVEQKRRYLEASRTKHERNILGDIFQLLRANPLALSNMMGPAEMQHHESPRPLRSGSVDTTQLLFQQRSQMIENGVAAQLDLQCERADRDASTIVRHERWRGLDMLLRRAEKQHITITSELKAQRETLGRLSPT